MLQKPQTSLICNPWVWAAGKQGYEFESYWGKTQLLPELADFGWIKFHQSLTGGHPPNRHPDVIEIHYLARGHLHWFVEKEQYEFDSGMVLITLPNELHGDVDDAVQPCELYKFQIHIPPKGKLPGLTVNGTQKLRQAYKSITCRVFKVTHDVGELFRRFLEEHRNRCAIHAQDVSRALLHALLFKILRAHNLQQESKKAESVMTWRVLRSIEWLEQHVFQSNARIAQMAAKLGLSSSGLRARFKTETGYTPREYLVRRRMEEAARLLAATNDSITTVAYKLVFSSSQHFSKVFRQQIGISPTNYRRRHRLPKGNKP